MTITLDLPEDIATELAQHGEDVQKAAMESLAISGYRAGKLSEEQVRRMLGLESRFDVHALLKRHDVYLDYTESDLEHDLAVALTLHAA